MPTRHVLIYDPNDGRVTGAACLGGGAVLANAIDCSPAEAAVWRTLQGVDGTISSRDAGLLAAEEEARAAAAVRAARDGRLRSCDWTQAVDAPVDAAAWATYRQALRDIPEQAGFPFIIDWPAPPQPQE